MEDSYCWRAVAYVERNPVRAGIAEEAAQYRWSSAAARVGAASRPTWLDLGLWNEKWSVEAWRVFEASWEAEVQLRAELQEATLSGYPLGGELVERLERERGVRLRKGKSGRPPAASAATSQFVMF